jgi:hypothetical protein
VESLKRRGGEIKMLVLTGHFSGAEELETDMLLVGTVKPVAVGRIISEFEQKLGKPIRYTIMDEKEYWDRKDLGDKFLYSVFEGKNITVVDDLVRK